jgi:glyoxylase-like metal-dependent hydrolase (beta-lactamase superfamily II)
MLGENHVLGDPASDDDRIQFTLYAFLADGGPGQRTLIDLGPIGLEYLNNMFRQFDFFRELPGDPDAIVQPHGNVFDWLERLGIACDEINHVVFTHLHADHHGLIDGKDGGAITKFPNATIHVSGRGWQNNLSHRKEGQWNSYVDFAFSDFLLEASEQGRMIAADNAQIAPGISTIYLGGHSIGSQAVRIETQSGPAVVSSDDVYRFDILEKGVIARLHTTPQRLLAATTRLTDLVLDEGATLLPCHEPMLFEAYQQHDDAWIKVIKPVSTAAAAHFRDASKQSLI